MVSVSSIWIGFALALSSQPCGQLIGGVEQPGIAGFGGEQDQLTDGDDAAQLIIYPDSNHGSQFQYPELFVRRHVSMFLNA